MMNEIEELNKELDETIEVMKKAKKEGNMSNYILASTLLATLKCQREILNSIKWLNIFREMWRV